MTQLLYYTSEALESLRSTVAERLDWYFAPDGACPAKVLPSGVRETRFPAPALAGQFSDAKNPSKSDVDNAILVYKALSGLTSHQASIERMWTWVCHCDCPAYVAGRWLTDRPKKEEDAVRKVENHFFAMGNRALIRDNGVSRLWWLGKIAHDVSPGDPREFLTILLHRQDVRSALIERPSVSMNRKVLHGIFGVMREQWADGGRLFKREAFRSWMVALNRRGGVVLLDALPEPELERLLRQESENALAENSSAG